MTFNINMNFSNEQQQQTNNRNTFPTKYMQSQLIQPTTTSTINLTDDLINRRSSSQSVTSISTLPSNNNNNSHGNYVDIDTIEQLRKLENYFQINNIKYQSFDRIQSINQNHPHTLDGLQQQINNNMLALRNYSGTNLTEQASAVATTSQQFNKQYSGTTKISHTSPLSLPHNSQG